MKQQLLTMQMPAMCDHQAGQLVDGKLPQQYLKDGRGQVSVLTAEASTPEEQVVAVQADVNGDGAQEHVVQVLCDQGGVGWPAKLMLLDNNLNVLVPTLKMPEQPQQARGTFEKIDVRNGQLYLKYRAMGPKDAAAAPSLMEEGMFRVEGDRLVAVDGASTSAPTTAPANANANCQPGRIAAELGRSEKETHVDYCDGTWAKFGVPATEHVRFARFDGNKWQLLKPDGTMTTGIMGECWLPETVAKLNPPQQISLMTCKPGQYQPLS